MPITSVLFVCIENAGRSQMAEAFAKFYGSEDLRAYSAGSRPSGTINRQAINVMSETGYDLTTHRSKSLAEIPDIEFDVVVTMGCGDECPFIRAKQHLDWDIPDPKGRSIEEVRRIRDLIRDRVQELLKHSE
jgi:arsenate reductase